MKTWTDVQEELRRIDKLLTDAGIDTSKFLLPPGVIADALDEAYGDGCGCGYSRGMADT